MKTTGIVMWLSMILLAFTGCANNQTASLWDRHCAACHDGQTILNEKIVMSREKMISEFKDKTLNDFVDACGGSASCMNILKHQEKLLRAVGKEIGIEESSEK